MDARTGRPADESIRRKTFRRRCTGSCAGICRVARENRVPQLAQMGADARRRGDIGDARRTQMRRCSARRGRWARSERAGELSSAPRLPLSSAQPLASPDPNRVYALDPGLPASAQRAPLTALAGRGDGAKLAGPIAVAGGRRCPLTSRRCPGVYCLVAADGRASTRSRAVATRADGSAVSKASR